MTSGRTLLVALALPDLREGRVALVVGLVDGPLSNVGEAGCVRHVCWRVWRVLIDGYAGKVHVVNWYLREKRNMDCLEIKEASV